MVFVGGDNDRYYVVHDVINVVNYQEYGFLVLTIKAKYSPGKGFSFFDVAFDSVKKCFYSTRLSTENMCHNIYYPISVEFDDSDMKIINSELEAMLV